MKKNNLLKIIFANIFIALLGTSCVIGLDKAIDLKGPSVSITWPKPLDSVGDKFDIKGTAEDAYGVTYFSLTVDGQKWVWNNGAWSYKPKNSDFYESVPNSSYNFVCDWITLDDSKHCEWSIKNIETIAVSGDYVISVSATDAAGNTSKDSVASRTITFDKEDPVVKVTNPTKLILNKTDAETEYTETDYKNFAKLPYYINKEFKLSGLVEDDYNIRKLVVDIYKSDGTTKIWSSKKLYTKKEYAEEDMSKNPPDDFTPIGNDDYEVRLTLRNWSIDVPDLSAAPYNLSGKNILLIKTSCWDASVNENKDTNKPQGYFCYWPEADKPWSTISLGDSGSPTECYPGSTIQGYSYDDDGIGKITLTLYSEEDYNTAVETKTLYEYKAGEAKSTYKAWQINVPEESHQYKAVIELEDIYGIGRGVNPALSSAKVGYFRVTDTDFPEIKVKSPGTNAPLFGDDNGNVTFNIEAYDNNNIASIKMVYIKKDSDAVKYLVASNNVWNFTTDGNDSTGNKVWNLTPTTSGTVSSTDNRKKYTASKEINIFNDLGINGNEGNQLNGQHFIFFASDSSNTKANKSVLDYSIIGDAEKPQITIDTITVKHSDNTTNAYKVSDYCDSTGDPKTYEENGETKTVLFPYFKTGDTVSFSGKWSDNSTTHWSDKSKIITPIVKWGTTSATVTRNNNGTWSTSDMDFIAGSVMALSAEIKDYAGNTTLIRKLINVQTDPPELRNITANNSNGSYGPGETITIVLKFNKPMTKVGDPKLTLNNGKTIALSRGNGSQEFEFDYEVASGDTAVDVLTVNSISGDFKDNQNITITGTLPPEKNLGDNKKIKIVTAKPKLASSNPIVLTTDTDHPYGKTLTIKFDVPINKGEGNIVIEQTNVTAVPAVLSESEWRKLTGIQGYYDKGTNGANSDFEPYLETKYILKYEYDSSNSYNTSNGNVKKAYTDNNYHKVTIGVNTSKVSLSDDRKTLTVDLTNDPLPCLGATYRVNIPAKLVYNDVEIDNDADNTKTFDLGGLEEPVIRIQKEKWQLQDNNKATRKAKQPTTSQFKVDCETPGSSVSSSYTETKSTGITLSTMPTAGCTNFNFETAGSAVTNSKTLGTTDYKYGAKYYITAKATKTGATEKNAYEVAYRTVIVMKGINSKIVQLRNSLDTQIWIRGGDDTMGANTTPGFPITWDTTVPNGAALLTKGTNDDDKNDWYFVSWEINTTCYCAPLEGTVDGQSGTQGPGWYIYAQNEFITVKENYGIAPGGYLILDCTTNEVHPNYWTL